MQEPVPLQVLGTSRSTRIARMVVMHWERRASRCSDLNRKLAGHVARSRLQRLSKAMCLWASVAARKRLSKEIHQAVRDLLH